MTMKKNDVIKEVARRSGRTIEEVTSVLEHQAAVLAEALVRDGAVNVPDLGKAKKVVRKAVAARQSVNPKTREPMVIPAQPETVSFKLKLNKGFSDRIDAVGATAQAPTA